MTAAGSVLTVERTADRAECAVSIATAADSRAWDAFVDRMPAATGYHVWAWRAVFERGLGHEPIYLLARSSGEIVGVLPLVFVKSLLFGRSLTSLPFLNYGGVLATRDDVKLALVDRAAAIGRERRCTHVELRHVERHLPDAPCRQHKVSMHLELAPGMWDRLDRKVRNQVRKAQKSGLVSEVGGVELLDDFYTVFARNMRDLGTPVYSPRLFAEVLSALPDQARLHIVRLDGRPIAAGLTFRSRETVEVPWASSIRDYNSLCPNHLLYWSVIEAALEHGCRRLDFGRSTPEEGTYKFKEQWGAQPVPLFWEYPLLPAGRLPDTGPANPKFRFAVELWKKLPLAVATRLGPAIVRGIP